MLLGQTLLCCTTRHSMVPCIRFTRVCMSRPWLTCKRSVPCCSMHITLPSISLTAVTQCCRIGAKLLLTTHSIGLIPLLRWCITCCQICLLSSSLNLSCHAQHAVSIVAHKLYGVTCYSCPTPPMFIDLVVLKREFSPPRHNHSHAELFHAQTWVLSYRGWVPVHLIFPWSLT
jgi:hypothetical protein